MTVNIGLDIGIASVGLSVIDAYTGDILEATSYIFECADAAKNEERRTFRQSKRLVRRRQNRIRRIVCCSFK